jgi:hypothetical protein
MLPDLPDLTDRRREARPTLLAVELTRLVQLPRWFTAFETHMDAGGPCCTRSPKSTNCAW